MIIKCWTDGSCVNSSGARGGYGILMRYEDGSERQWYGGSYINSTSVRQELRAVVMALKKVKEGDEIIIHSDSEYCVNAVEKKWVWRWQNNGFLGKKNADLWKQFLNEASRLKSKIKMVHVRGHSGIRENEICDHLAKMGGNKKKIIKDKKQ